MSMNGFVKAAQEGRILLLGHQGVYGEAPANSLSGFRKAVEMGLDGIEAVFIARDRSAAYTSGARDYMVEQ